jgi:branched-chain amino acid aminotransferase
MSVLPFDQREGFIWLNGQLLPWGDAKLHVLSHGLHYGSCVFEGERAYEGRIFKSREHTERFKNSAQILDFELPYSVDELEAAKALVLEKNGWTSCYVRPVAWRGSEMMAVAAQDSTINVAIAMWDWPSMFDVNQKMRGIRLDIADAMMLDWEGRVAECTGANILFVKDGAIHTPLADCFLDGITRRTVIALAKARGIAVHERRIMPEELAGFDECFICGTGAEVTPVSEVGPYTFTPGALSQALMEDYSALVRKPS